jgi:hypothetical protein
MKKFLALYWMAFLACGPALKAGEDATLTQKGGKDVSLFQVPWQCPAAPAIGCGSHAKPILLQLKQMAGVREAWMNRQGTMVAIVWNSDSKKKQRHEVEKMLKEHKASKIGGAALSKPLDDFRAHEGWYRGAEVDKLSEEEAGVIAARWVRRLEAKTTLAREKADGLQTALTEALKKCLTGKVAVPQGEEERSVELRRVAGPFLDDAQLKVLGEAAECGMRAMPNEE